MFGLKHEKYDLWLPDDSEYAELVGSELISRRRVSDSPLACVDELCFYDGAHIAAKTMRAGMHETLFYKSVSSPVLPRVILSRMFHGCQVLMLEYTELRRLGDYAPDYPHIARVSEYLSAETARLDQNNRVPVLVDITGRDKWLRFVEDTLVKLTRMCADGLLPCESCIPSLLRAAESDNVLALADSPCGLLHGSLTPGNVFIDPEGLRLSVTGWKRPIRGPLCLDRLILETNCGFAQDFDEGNIMRMFLDLAWYIRCAQNYAPEAGFAESVVATVYAIENILGA